VTIVEIPRSVRTYVDAFSRGDVDECMDTFAPDGTYSDPGIPQPLSGQALKDHFAGVFTSFPDATCETKSLDPTTKDVWAWRWVVRGTNTGPIMGLPPTGRSVTLPGCEFIEVRGDKIHSIEGYFDRLTLLGQLGLAPSPPARSAT
jgi:steroid delta-isomerase-like uncharacterized protein